MADELINLVEFAKGLSDPLSSGMIEQFAGESDVLRALQFKTVSKGLNVFDRETSLPAVKFRALNIEPEISYGSEEQFQDACYPISGLIEFDRIKLKRYGERKRMTYMKGQMSSGSRLWTDTFIKGDNASDPTTFSGCQARLKATGATAADVNGTKDDSRLVVNNQASGGGALSLSMFDRAIRLVNKPSHILMNRNMHTRFTAAARDQNVSGHLIHTEMEQGHRITRYNGVPILVGYEVSKGSSFLPFNEVAWGGGAAVTSSIYVVSFREDGVCGIQTSAPEFIPVDTDRGVFRRDLFEWDCGITIEDFYSALRLSSITDAPIVA